MSHDDGQRLISQDLESEQLGQGEQIINGTDNESPTDYPAAEPVKYTSQFAAFLITVNVTVGAGLLAMPFAIQTSGLITSLIVQVFFLAFIITTCIICTELTVKTEVNSFHRVVQVHCHHLVYQVTQIAILLMVFGAVVAFIVIIGDQSDRVFASLYGSKFCLTWYMNRRFVMSFVTVFVIKPLCCAKTVDFLKYGSFAGVASLGFIMYVVISEFLKQGHIAKDVNYFPKDLASIGSVLPVFCFAYQCHLSWIPTAATIRKEEKYTTYKTITIAMIVTTIIYMLVSTLALLTFGSGILNDLTESYPGKSWPILTTVAIVALKCAVTLPPAFLPAKLTLIDVLSNSFERFARLNETMKSIAVTLVTLNIALLLALYVPNIVVAVDIIGCMAVMFIFTLPGLCYLNLIKQNRLEKQNLVGSDNVNIVYSAKDQVKRIISIFFIIFGSVMTFVVLYKSIDNMLKSTPNSPLCDVTSSKGESQYRMHLLPNLIL